ncbi:MAG: glycoside-pentoside-hexuronide (GPH):cation symporter [Acutalibacteraceae bacterium]
MKTQEKPIGKWRQRLGYGSSDFACNLIWQMISLYLLYFYTNVMKLDAAAIALMFLITKFIDGVTDLIVGFLIDKTHTRWGKSRPWILFGAVPFALFAFLAFNVPDFSMTGKIVYAYITYSLLSLSYTVVNIPMASILPALTDDAQERTNLATTRICFSSIGSTVVSSLALPLVAFFGSGNEVVGFKWVMLIFGVVGALVFFFTFFNTRETNLRENTEKVNIWKNIKVLAKNGPWRLFALNIVWFFGGYVIQLGAIVYYFKYNLNNAALASVAATITTLVPLAANLAVPFITKKLSKRNVMQLGGLVQIIGILVIFFSGQNVAAAMVGVVISALGSGLRQTVYFSMQPDPVDYSEWKDGVNISGTLSAVNGFIGKVAMALASSLSAMLLGWGGFNADVATQSASALSSISAMYIWIPIVFIILDMITMSFYKLDKQYPQIMKELEERNQSKEA